MKDCFRLNFREESVDGFLVSDICFSEMHRSIAVVMGDVSSLSCAEVIDNEDLITTLYAGIDEMGTDKSGTTCYKYFHT